MKSIELDRREAVCLTAGFAISAVALPSRIAIADELHEWLATVVAGETGLRDPARTGTMSAEEFDAFWALFERIGELWELSAFTTIDRTALRDMLDLKAESPPSYFTEYRAGAKAIRHTLDRIDSRTGAFDLLITGTFDADEIAATRLGRLRRHVVGELITLQVSHGGFRRFGYKNYRGYMGGVFSDPDDLPYRSMS